MYMSIFILIMSLLISLYYILLICMDKSAIFSIVITTLMILFKYHNVIK